MLSTELIDNTHDRVAVGRRRRSAEESPDAALIDRTTQLPRCGAAIHLTPTRRKRKNKDGDYTRNTFQGRCMICRQKTIYQCSQCKDESVEKDVGWLCHTMHGKMCFVEHTSTSHEE